MKLIIAFKNPKVDNPSACHTGLGVTSGNTAEVLRENGIDVEALPVTDGYYIRDSLRSGKWGKVTHVVCSAPYFDTAFLETLCREFPHIQFAVNFHSNVGFLGSDNWSTRVLREQLALEGRIKNFHTAGNSAKFRCAVEAAYGSPCLLLPNLYFLHGTIARKRCPKKTGAIKIGAFGATRVLKNLPTAAWAAHIMARRIGRPVEFWISGGREEGNGAGSVIKGIREQFAGCSDISLHEAHWDTWPMFRMRFVRWMDLLLQPSFTESFNGVTADGIAEGVPSVVGQAIDWVPRNWHANPDDACEIATVGVNLLRRRRAQHDGYVALKRHNRSSLRAWKAFLGQSDMKKVSIWTKLLF